MTGRMIERDAAYASGRSTAQRRAVAAAVRRIDGAFRVEELAAAVRADAPGISTATVYRSLAAMLSSGYLSEVGRRGSAALYARCDEPGHHHHVVCTSCGAMEHTPCPIDAAGLTDVAPSGFLVTSHEVRLYGLCAACRSDASAEGCSCDAVGTAG